MTTVITNTAGLSNRPVQLSATTESSGTLFAQADSAGVVNDTNRANNISVGADFCAAAADSYESDNTAGTASTINLGQTQTHNFDKMGDQDWIKFTAEGGQTYILSTSNLGTSADTYLYLYDTDGASLLASNDDFGGTLASGIEWTAGKSGTYYLLVKHWNPSVGGCGTSYDFSISNNHADILIYLPFLSR